MGGGAEEQSLGWCALEISQDMFGSGVSSVVPPATHRQLLWRPVDGVVGHGEEQGQERCALEFSQDSSPGSSLVATSVLVRSRGSCWTG